ncbi:MAG: glycosyltransferase family 2 protein [Patescibacteria group bacterium]
MFSIVIPNYNGRQLLESCLGSIKSNLVDEIIVVDNGSTDGSVKYLKKQGAKLHKFRSYRHSDPPTGGEESLSKEILRRFAPQDDKNVRPVKLIQNHKNLGFAKAVNQGIQIAKNDYVLVLNNDVRLDGKYFDAIHQAIKENPKLGACCGLVWNWSGQSIESTGLEFEVKGKSALIRNDHPKGIVFGAPASAVAYYKPALLKAGLFDEDFFAYLEDVDLSIRLNSRGFKTLYVPRAIAYHRGGATSDQLGNLRYRMTARNWIFIFLKHYPVSTFLKHLPAIVVEQSKNLLAVKQPSDILWVIKEVITKCPKILKKRQPSSF